MITIDTIVYCIQGKMILDNILERNYYSDYQKNFSYLFPWQGNIHILNLMMRSLSNPWKQNKNKEKYQLFILFAVSLSLFKQLNSFLSLWVIQVHILETGLVTEFSNLTCWEQWAASWGAMNSRPLVVSSPRHCPLSEPALGTRLLYILFLHLHCKW